MPVLFYEKAAGVAGAFTTDHANSLVDGTTVITGESYGPVVDYDGMGARDILRAYVRAIFVEAGYPDPNIIMADARWYHNNCGSLHCGSNVQRGIPTYLWWVS